MQKEKNFICCASNRRLGTAEKKVMIVGRIGYFVPLYASLNIFENLLKELARSHEQMKVLPIDQFPGIRRANGKNGRGLEYIFDLTVFATSGPAKFIPYIRQNLGNTVTNEILESATSINTTRTRKAAKKR